MFLAPSSRNIFVNLAYGSRTRLSGFLVRRPNVVKKRLKPILHTEIIALVRSVLCRCLRLSARHQSRILRLACRKVVGLSAKMMKVPNIVYLIYKHKHIYEFCLDIAC